MKKLFIFIIVVLFISPSINSQEIPEDFKKVKESGGIEEYVLESNNLSILLMEDHSAPVLTFMVTYRVGSRNEVTGTTGATHLLEHLMFKGTPTFNKKSGTQIAATLQNIGAVINATTWLDRTNYYENIPSDQLELAVHLESDRMRNSLLLAEDKESEMTVVRNEFEQGENNPLEALDKELWATAYQAHPYHHSTIGWKSDIENVPIEKLREFYNTFYWPNNATVTIIGDFQKSNAFELIKKYFGGISASPHKIPDVYTEEPVQQGPRKIILKRSGQLGVVGVAYKVPEGVSKENYSLQVLDNILTSGNSSRLYKKIIDKNLGTDVFTFYVPFKDPGLFILYVNITPGIKHEDIEKIILDELELIKKEGVAKEEVNRAINQILAQTAYKRDGSFSIASQINEAIAIGDWTYYVTFSENIKKVTPDAVQNVVKNFINEDMSTTGYFIPKTNSGDLSSTGAANFEKPNYYRNPDEADILNEPLTSKNNKIYDGNTLEKSDREIVREKISDIDVITVKTGVKDIITFTGSFTGGDYYSPKNNLTIADLTAGMLDKGTTKNDKFALSEKLANLGAKINFGVNTHNVAFNGQCLKQDLSTVINLLAEQLRYPAFNADEFEKLKKQNASSMKQLLDNTNTRADNKLNQLLFPEDHPNHSPSIEKIIEDFEKASLDDVKEFYKNYYGPESMIFVAVGDLDNTSIHKAIKESFSGWSGGVKAPVFEKGVPQVEGKTSIVTVPEKTSATLMIGLSTNLKKSDKEYLPLHVANYILGGNFSARLMSIIRDDEGLTYGIYSAHNNDIYSGGRWFVQGAFNPDLMEKGKESTLREIKRWIENGVTADELKNKKSTIVGQFKVQLATTTGMANQILSFVQRGFSPDYIDKYPGDIEALTIDQVNNSIKKYVKPGNFVIVMAGSMDENGKPLQSSSR